MSARAATPARGALVVIGFVGSLLACGETRRGVGEECLKNDDCLSGFCTARTCVGAPILLGGATSPPPSVGSDAGVAPDVGVDAPADAQGG